MEIFSEGFPVSWKIKKLKDISNIIMGQSPESSTYNTEKEGLPFFQGKTEFGEIHPKIVKWCKKPIKISYPNDVLISVRAPVGDVNINNRDACIGRGLGAIRAHKNLLDYKFLFYVLIQNRGKFLKYSQGSTFTAINSYDLSNFQVLLPPLLEQNKIASILSTVDNLIENTDHLIISYTLLKKGLMQTLLTKGIGHTEFKKTEISEIPIDWEVISLEKLGTTYNGLTGKNKEHFGQGKAYIPYKNIFNNTKIDINYLDFVTIGENEKQNRVKYGDIFFTISSETAEEVGYSSVLLDSLENVYLNSFCFGFRLRNFNIVKPEFLRYLLRGKAIRKSIVKIGQGYTRFNLSKAQVLKIVIPIPSIKEQLKIASILSTIDEYLEIYIAKKKKLNLLKKGLMQQLLTGKISVKV